MVTYFFLISYMLLAHIVDYSVCNIHIISFIIKENVRFDTTPFHEIDEKVKYPYYS